VTIEEFPLAWRWVDSRYALLPQDVLARMLPCPPEQASRVFDRAASLERVAVPDAARISADGAPDKVIAWLRSHESRVNEDVFVSWSPDTALQTSWGTFTERWDDFCYPSSDDVTVTPRDESWILLYHHWHEFEFRPKPSA